MERKKIKTMDDIRTELQKDIDSTFVYLTNDERIFLNSYFNEEEWKEFFPNYEGNVDYKKFTLDNIDLINKHGNFLASNFIEGTCQDLSSMNICRNLIENRQVKEDFIFYLKCLIEGSIDKNLSHLTKYKKYIEVPNINKYCLASCIKQVFNIEGSELINKSKYKDAYRRFLRHKNNMDENHELAIGTFLADEMGLIEFYSFLDENKLDIEKYNSAYKNLYHELQVEHYFKIMFKEKKTKKTFYDYCVDKNLNYDWDYLTLCIKVFNKTKRIKKCESLLNLKKRTGDDFSKILIKYFTDLNQDHNIYDYLNNN